MMSKLKTLGCALTAALAIGAMTASAAQAELTFTGYDGIGNHVDTGLFGTQGGFFGGSFEFRPTAKEQGVSCTKAGFTSTLKTGKSKTITAAAANNITCKLWPLRETNRYMNTCDYTYNITKKINEHKYEGTTDIDCTEPNDAIDYQVTEAFPNEKKTRCTITLPDQSSIGPIYYENVTPTKGFKYIEIKANATNVKSTTEAPTSGLPEACNVDKLGAHNSGTLTEETVVTGLHEEEEVNVTVSG